MLRDTTDRYEEEGNAIIAVAKELPQLTTKLAAFAKGTATQEVKGEHVIWGQVKGAWLFCGVSVFIAYVWACLFVCVYMCTRMYTCIHVHTCV